MVSEDGQMPTSTSAATPGLSPIVVGSTENLVQGRYRLRPDKSETSGVSEIHSAICSKCGRDLCS